MFNEMMPMSSGGGTLNPQTIKNGSAITSTDTFTVDLTKNYIVDVTLTRSSTPYQASYLIDKGTISALYEDTDVTSYFGIELSGTTITLTRKTSIGQFYYIATQLD